MRQKRTFDDTQGDELAEVIVFLKEWQTVLQDRLSKADKERAKQSKILRLEGMKELRKNKTVVRTGYLSGKLLADVLEADLIDITIEEQEEKKSNLENLSDEDFDLMLEEMLKERKERKRKREKDFEM